MKEIWTNLKYKFDAILATIFIILALTSPDSTQAMLDLILGLLVISVRELKIHLDEKLK